jgi:hypothetical protein
MAIPKYRRRDCLENSVDYCRRFREGLLLRLARCQAMVGGPYSTVLLADATRDNGDLRQAEQSKQQTFWAEQLAEAIEEVAEIDAIIAGKIAAGENLFAPGQQMDMFGGPR